jgi:hypothetical protein
MLPSGFEPESKPRKGLMIGRYTTGANEETAPPRFELGSPAPKAKMLTTTPRGHTYGVLGVDIR